jgi:large subunit ribosomal protein L4
MAVATYTKSGNKATTAAKLNKNVFGIEVKTHDLLKRAYLAYLANGRDNFAVTKKRGEVRGGGAKPWRQKGTGRARVGSSRNPVWRGGGVAFGPTGLENYTHKLNTKAKRQALRQALSLAAHENRIKVIESFAISDGKSKKAADLLNKIDANKTALVVVANRDEKTDRATANLKHVRIVNAKYLQVFDVLNSDTVIITNDSLAVIHEWLGDKDE